ncbi:nuclear transport factor 2 family protein [Kineosporia sp. R_H_3]|uniref:nuclear transport factor 2 family protein n=1 Tax=Kineosporia sp. R_H_3 TaxID=1961848 RepID=UPI001304369C|nr:nuclear transport factor 2 family protein [Kineosporia sp. R_H_3]
MNGPGTDHAWVYASLQEHFARYFDACDRCDLDAVMQVLDGATVAAGGLETDDPQRIRALYEARQPAPAPDGRRTTKHHATNLVLEGPGADGPLRATVYYFRLEPGDAGPVVAASGRLEEVVVRDGDRWRVVRHTIVSDL